MRSGSGARIDSDAAGAEQADHEAGEDLERDVPGEHVGEQAQRQRDRPRQERDHLDHDDEGQEPDRHARGHEQPEEMGAVLDEAVDHDRADHEHARARR